MSVSRGRGTQMRRYDDPVEVRRGQIGGPEQFLWRGRLWQVRQIVAHWIETGAWWTLDEVGSDLLAEREIWRVEAGRGAIDNGGVFDLAFDWSDGRWQLVGCVD